MGKVKKSKVRGISNQAKKAGVGVNICSVCGYTVPLIGLVKLHNATLKYLSGYVPGFVYIAQTVVYPAKPTTIGYYAYFSVYCRAGVTRYTMFE